MVDNCGNLVNEWDRGTRPGLSAYFLENGLMFRTYKASLKGPFTSASNAGGLELVDWDNHTVWNYEINTSESLSHHDAVMLPNGNILVLTWQLVYADDLISWGRDPKEIAIENYMWSEKIMELKPIGTDDAEIVWEWNIYDHYIQDFDESKDNFGVVHEHPELFDINLPQLNSSNSNATRDWNHFNAIDYNPVLDQILISVRNSDEIWIIDHSTTIEEAASHEGGLYGKGGDILYRWGNPAAYKTAEISSQQLFGQHGVHWVKDLENTTNSGKIMIFNNGNERPGPDFSQIDILEPPQVEAGYYVQEPGIPNNPLTAETIFGAGSGQEFYSPYLSNAQQLPNGNVLINSGSHGVIFEIDEDKEIVWEYIIPLFGDFPATQGDNINNNSNFRAYKYALDYNGFDDVDMQIGEPIENNPSDCEILVQNIETSKSEFNLYHDVYTNSITVNGIINEANLELIDLTGKVILKTRINSLNNPMLLPQNLTLGSYLVRVQEGKNLSVFMVMLQN